MPVHDEAKLKELTGLEDFVKPEFVREYNRNLLFTAWERQLSQFSDARLLYAFIEAFVQEVQDLFIEILKLQDARTVQGAYNWWLTKLAQILGAKRVQFMHDNIYWLEYDRDTAQERFQHDNPNWMNGATPDSANVNVVITPKERPTPYWVHIAGDPGENVVLDDETLRRRLYARILVNSGGANENTSILAILYALSLKVSFPKYYHGVGFTPGVGQIRPAGGWQPTHYQAPYAVILHAPNKDINGDPVLPGQLLDITIRYNTSLANNVYNFAFPAVLSIQQIVEYTPA